MDDVVVLRPLEKTQVFYFLYILRFILFIFRCFELSHDLIANLIISACTRKKFICIGFSPYLLDRK
jgi:hypothetical protein